MLEKLKSTDNLGTLIYISPCVLLAFLCFAFIINLFSFFPFKWLLKGIKFKTLVKLLQLLCRKLERRTKKKKSGSNQLLIYWFYKL